MKVVLQRVWSASITVNGSTISAIDRGILCYVSYAPTDTDKTFQWIVDKITGFRIFPDEQGGDRFDRSVRDILGSILIVSNFTLHAECKKGKRPDFSKAEKPEPARAKHVQFMKLLSESYQSVQDGEFGANMYIESVNDGPVTLILEKE